MTDKQTVILLSAYAQSGKDTAAHLIAQSLDAKQFYFAEPLYAMILTMFAHLDITLADLHRMKVNNERLPDCNVTVRQMLQTLGTEWGRTYVSETIWPSILAQKVKASGCKLAVVSDCRFVNEYHRIGGDGDFNTVTWFISRDECQPQTHHKSEQELLLIQKMANFQIDNNGSFENLEDELAKAAIHAGIAN